MRTFSCVLVATLLAFCAAQNSAAERRSELRATLIQICNSGRDQFDAIIGQVKSQNGGNLPEEVENIVTEASFPCALPTFVAPKKPSSYSFKGMEQLTEDQMKAVSYFLDEYFKIRDEEVRKFNPKSLGIRTPRQSCKTDDDCPFQQFCFDVSLELQRDMNRKGYGRFFEMVKQFLDLQHNECSPRVRDFLVSDVDTYMDVIRSAFDKISMVVNRTHSINGMEHWLSEFEGKIMKPFNFTKEVEESLAEIRQGAIYPNTYYPQQSPSQYQNYPNQPSYGYPTYNEPSSGIEEMLLPLLLLGGGGGTDMSSLLPLLLLGGGLGGSGGSDLSPLLLISLMGMGDSNPLTSGNNLMSLLLLTSFMGDGMGGSGGDLLPLFLILMMNSSSTDSMSLLPLLLLLGDDSTIRSGHDLYCAPQQQDPLTLILLLSALGGTSNGTDSNPLLSFMLLSSTSGCPGSSGIDPTSLLLLQSISGGNSNLLNSTNSLPLLLILGGLGGQGGQPDQSLLLLLLLSSSSTSGGTDMSSLLPILFLSDPNFANSPLAFLLLFNNNLFNTTGGSTSNLLFLLLFLGGGQSGLTGSGTAQPYSITQNQYNIPPPGGLPANTPSYSPSPYSSGPLGGFGTGNGIFEIIILMNLLGGTGGIGGTGSNDILLLLLLTGGLGGSGGLF